MNPLINDTDSLADLLNKIASEGEIPPTDTYGLAVEAVNRLNDTQRRDILVQLVSSVAQRYMIRLPTKRLETRRHRPVRDKTFINQRRAWLRTPEGQEFAERARRRDELEAATISAIGQSAYFEKQLKRFNDRLTTRIRAITIADLLSESLRNSYVSSGNGGDSSTWGAMSGKEHEERIEYLARQVDGDLSPIVQHIAAAALIAQHGCDSLNAVSDSLDQQLMGDGA